MLVMAANGLSENILAPVIMHRSWDGLTAHCLVWRCRYLGGVRHKDFSRWLQYENALLVPQVQVWIELLRPSQNPGELTGMGLNQSPDSYDNVMQWGVYLDAKQPHKRGGAACLVPRTALLCPLPSVI
jgi:hypothetical protein